MIHQHFNLVPRASVAENVVSGALPAVSTLQAITGLFPAAHRRRACELVAAVGLGQDQLRKRVEALSGGQQQRVGIARAFMLAPRVILADEPVASLDPQTSKVILGLLRGQARENGATVVCSLHQVDLARAFADRVIALRGGELVFDGSPQALTAAALRDIYRRPTSAPAWMAS
jgi:phosphonate transport system ATP-binding protein